jgi:isovaleryl-CoA dehydrogenase
LNLPLLRQLGELGLLGLTVDEDYGGSGMDATAVVLVHEELSASDPAFCLSYLAHSLLLVNNLHVNGNHDQKLQYLPDLVSGAKIGGMAMSEPSAGTDVLGMKTKAVLNNHDTDTDTDTACWTLNGQKMWITNGTLDGGQTTGDLFLVYAKTGPNRSDVTSFVVEKEMTGFSVGQQIHDKLGMRASPTAELVFDNVELPQENVIGDVNQATLCMVRTNEHYELQINTMKNNQIHVSRFGLTNSLFLSRSLSHF